MTNSANQNKDRPQNNSTILQTSSKSKALTLDVELYQSYLDDCDIPEDKKQEFLETLWAVVVGFVDLGFGIHPLQHSANNKAAETNKALAELISNLDPNEDDNATNSFKRATTPERING